METLLRIGEASRRLGFSIKQLRYFDALGLVPPRYIGAHRAYGEAEREHLRTIKLLLRRGFTPKQIQVALTLSGGRGRRQLPEDRAYRQLLRAALKAEQEVPVGEDFQRYNTAYKRLRRLGQEMALRPALRKRGETLYVRTSRDASARRNEPRAGGPLRPAPTAPHPRETSRRAEKRRR